MSTDSSRRPEEMASFFDARAGSYDQHMHETFGLVFEQYYGAVAAPVARTAHPVAVLDLGCGTGAEIAGILDRAPNARITCVDLSGEMLQRLSERYCDRQSQLTLRQGSFLDLDFGAGAYAFIVSVMSMHHFPSAVKRALYARICAALKPGGLYIEGDYYVSPDQEQEYLRRYAEQMQTVGTGLYHIDIPFSVDTQRQLLTEAGFTAVELICSVGQSKVLVATA